MTDLIEKVAEKISIFGYGERLESISPSCKKECVVAAKSAIQAIQDAGMVIVPREPTEAMLNAAVKVHVCANEKHQMPDQSEVYKAMIAAQESEDD